ncbi:MAG: Ig-like domain-containing protein [Thermoplasmata archaeon]|nr:MAG: Ig-like domain-containing protein [Thermoplasmata archaeon]
MILEFPEYDVDTIDWDDDIYSIHISAYDMRGNKMDASYTLTLDTSVPGVSHISVADALFPYTFTRITIYFTEPMNTQSVESALSIAPNLNYTNSWIDDDKTLRLENIEGLQLYETYKINLGAGAKDRAGNIFTNFPVYEFIATIDIDLDTDGDEIPDGWEFLYNLSPYDAADAKIDGDNDGHTNLEEFQGGSSPIDSNSIPLKSEEVTSALVYWWLIPILVVLIILTIALFILLMGERVEEYKGPRRELEDMYLELRAEKDIKAMESMLKDKEKLGADFQEAETLVRKAKEAFEDGNYEVTILYEKNLREMFEKKK